MHYKTYLTIVRLELMSYYNMDGRPKTTDTQKRGVWKHENLHSDYR